MRFQKTSSPKRLSISEMWQLYKQLKSGIKTPQVYLLDEVLEIMEGIDTESFKTSLRILYGNRVNYLEKSPVDLALMLVQGLKANQAFEFFDFIRTVQ